MAGLNLEPEGLLEMDSSDIETRCSALIARLSGSLTSVDCDDGWTEEARDAILALLRRLQNDLRNDIQVDEVPEYRSMARGLDHWGIEGGEIMERVAELSQAVRGASA